MTQLHQVAILLPLLAGAGATLGTICIHAVAVSATIKFIRREEKFGRTGTGLRVDLSIVALVISLSLAAHLIEIALWGGLFIACGEFHEFGIAYYHSAVNYTTLGYGDVIMTPSWRLLGPLEAADGSLMFGLSTAMAFAVVLRLIQTRYTDFRPTPGMD
jgi:ion channel